ncbi:hypothetical protein BKA70DRAFT_1437191 [Coprinopsis sp. MPI-PUGE-AT-0042]|nr:hypothetical protein BKA70DRAFT_1437191 [Coprinopsis sp. MPI-PUGE-AT-0042]
MPPPLSVPQYGSAISTRISVHDPDDVTKYRIRLKIERERQDKAEKAKEAYDRQVARDPENLPLFLEGYEVALNSLARAAENRYAEEVDREREANRSRHEGSLKEDRGALFRQLTSKVRPVEPVNETPARSSTGLYEHHSQSAETHYTERAPVRRTPDADHLYQVPSSFPLRASRDEVHPTRAIQPPEPVPTLQGTAPMRKPLPTSKHPPRHARYFHSDDQVEHRPTQPPTASSTPDLPTGNLQDFSTSSSFFVRPKDKKSGRQRHLVPEGDGFCHCSEEDLRHHGQKSESRAVQPPASYESYTSTGISTTTTNTWAVSSNFAKTFSPDPLISALELIHSVRTSGGSLDGGSSRSQFEELPSLPHHRSTHEKSSSYYPRGLDG